MAPTELPEAVQVTLQVKNMAPSLAVEQVRSEALSAAVQLCSSAAHGMAAMTGDAVEDPLAHCLGVAKEFANFIRPGAVR